MGPNGSSSGYTPASYITYSDDERHFCAHDAAVVVDAPVSLCFGLWDDWHRLVDYMDLIAQVGGSGTAHACPPPRPTR
jgi:aminopeptidase-like protein